MNKKIKILQVIGSLHIGGAENTVMNFARYIDKDYFQCDFLVFGKDVGQYEKEAVELGSRVIHIPHPSKGYINYMRNLKEILIKGKYDVVHAHTLLSNGLTLKVAYDCNIRKRISHSHSTDSGRKENIVYKLYKIIMKKLIQKYATDFFSCGKEAGEFLYGEKLFRKSGKIINNGIVIKNYVFDEKKREKVRQIFGLDKQLVIGHIGRITAAKNHEFLIEIFYELHRLRKNTKLLIVGDGELRPLVENKIKDLDLEDSVIITGMRTDVVDILQAIDIIVFPSLYEGFPVAMIEAQAAGVPCIVSKNITTQVKITELVNFLSLQENASIWATKILELEKVKRINKSKELIEKGFDIFSTINLLENLYEN
ncbi:glycosyltransferase family 1 protein [Ectobacillus polymachus]|uniref:glycosyltransferase family 1 protein n=1 Tax=Ectobacillus polymachus TaxID=1508806 RepID=UPI003A88604E